MAAKPLVVWKGGIPNTFRYSDGGRHDSKHTHEDNDCTVRAIAIAFGISYDDAYNFLRYHGRKPSDAYQIHELLSDYCKQKLLFNCQISKIPFPTRKGYQRMNMAAFCHLYPTGTYILSCLQHVSTCIDGIIHDTWWRPNECVYSAYHIIKTPL